VLAERAVLFVVGIPVFAIGGLIGYSYGTMGDGAIAELIITYVQKALQRRFHAPNYDNTALKDVSD
jgi:hypothetical protein